MFLRTALLLRRALRPAITITEDAREWKKVEAAKVAAARAAEGRP
jgi:hypothetical protein